MPYEHPAEETGIVPAFRFTVIAGGAAGDFTVTGIAEEDKLSAVLLIDFALTEGTPNTRAWTPSANLTSQFSITAANTINNTGGTASTGGILLVAYFKKHAGPGDV
jgi:Ni,Fe-hydrogenase maturation factor